MTTIAWDGKTLAADSQSQQENIICSQQEIKIYVNPADKAWAINGIPILAFGTSGDCGAEVEIIDALISDLSYKTEFIPLHSFEMIAVINENEAFIVNKNRDSTSAYISFHKGKYAIGSGGLIATAAMQCGKNAEEAVKVAIDIDLYTGGQINTFSLLD